MKTRILFSAILLSLCIPGLFSQSPQKTNYQAVVRNASGDPITETTVGVRLTILLGNSPGTPVCVEEFSPTTNEFGLITLEIGSVNTVDFQAIDWSAGQYYLKVGLDVTGSTNYTEMGITQLVSVPYALHAETAEVLLGDEKWQTSGSDIYYNDGNVGIGITSPQAKLDVAGDIISGNEITLWNSTLAFCLRQDESQSWITNKENFLGNGSTQNGALNLHGQAGLTLRYGNTEPAGSIGFFLNSAGNVGIGTINPQARLDVKSSTGWSDETPLFEVKNEAVIPVFAVFNNGVRVLIDDTDGLKGVKGGFAIGGYDYTKAGSTVDFMRITPDSIRFNINNSSTKAVKGGFAIGGYGSTKGDINEDFMYITPQQSTVGQYNTFLGYLAGTSNIGGEYNTFFGYEAGKKTTGTAGGEAGDHNVFIGYRSGFSNFNGYNNIYIGYEAGYTSTNTGANICIGHQSGKSATGSGSVFLGQLTGEKSTGNANTFIGTQAGRNTSGGYQNTFMGSSAGFNNQGGNRNTFLGYEAGNAVTSGSNNIAIGYQTQVPTATASNQIRLGNSSITYAGIQVAWTVTSDIRWKESIDDLHLGLNFVNKLKPVDYMRKNNDNGKREAGFIAQDIEKLFEEMGIEDAGLLSKGDDGFLELRYNDFIPILTKAIQEQQSIIDNQQKQIDELKAMISSMAE